MKRSIIFGDYDTWLNWGLTLTGWELSAPEYKSSFVSVPGRDGDLDLSTALSDGEPRYKNRELSATFEISSGTRLSRKNLFNQIVNALDGRRVNINLPDDLTDISDLPHYITGRLHVIIQYNDPSHGALKITGNCDPWRYSSDETSKFLTAANEIKTVLLQNDGRRLVVPTIVVSGTNASVQITFSSRTWTLSAGTYTLPDLVLRSGINILTYSGTGTVMLTWREAVL